MTGDNPSGLTPTGVKRAAGRAGERAGGGQQRRRRDGAPSIGERARPPASAGAPAALFARARARCDSTYFIDSRRASRWIVSFSFFFWMVSARESSSTASAWRSMWPRAELRSRLRSPTRLCADLSLLSWCRLTNEWQMMRSSRHRIIGTPAVEEGRGGRSEGVRCAPCVRDASPGVPSHTARRTQPMLWSDLKQTGEPVSACEQSGYSVFNASRSSSVMHTRGLNWVKASMIDGLEGGSGGEQGGRRQGGGGAWLRVHRRRTAPPSPR